MTGTCDRCGRTYYNASGCECILAVAAPLNTTEVEMNAMKAALNDPGSRPNDPSPSPNCDACGALLPPGATADSASGILLCSGGCAARPPDIDDPQAFRRDLAVALLLSVDATPEEVLRRVRLVMAERMEMQSLEMVRP